MPVRAIVYAVVAIVIVTVIAVTTLSALGKPTADLVQLVALIVVPTVTSLLLLVKVNNVETKIDDVHKQVNGRMSQLLDKVPDSEKQG
jgi:hypothetical protein